MTTYIRRTADARSLWPGRRLRYEVWQDGEPRRVLELAVLDRLLNGRRFPADFWATVGAADRAFEAGDRGAVFEYPGYRHDHPPGQGVPD